MQLNKMAASLLGLLLPLTAARAEPAMEPVYNCTSVADGTASVKVYLGGASGYSVEMRRGELESGTVQVEARSGGLMSEFTSQAAGMHLLIISSKRETRISSGVFLDVKSKQTTSIPDGSYTCK